MTDRTETVATEFIENFGIVDVVAVYDGDKVDYYDIFFTVDGECLNQGDPFHDDQPTASEIEEFLFPKD